MWTKNFYELLGVSPQATDEEVKKAYRAISKKIHPDKGGTVADFQAINEAYRILSNPQQREEYDLNLRYSQSSYSQREKTQTEPQTETQQETSSKSGFFIVHFLLVMSSCMLIYYGVMNLAEQLKIGKFAGHIIYFVIIYYYGLRPIIKRKKNHEI